MAARPAFRRAGIAACIDYPPTPCDSAVSLPGAALYVRSILLPCSRGVTPGNPYTTTPALRATPPEDRRGKIQTSPDLRAVLGLAPHRVPFLDAEGVVERLEVHQRADGADGAGRVGIGGKLLAQGILAHVGAPHLRPREEEALLGREPVDELFLLAGDRALERFVGEARAAEIGDVLAEGQLAVHFHPGQRLVAV